MLEQACAIAKYAKWKKIPTENVDIDEAYGNKKNPGGSMYGISTATSVQIVFGVSNTDTMSTTSAKEVLDNLVVYTDMINNGSLVANLIVSKTGASGHYALVPGHWFAIESIDIDSQTIRVIDPFKSGVSFVIPFDIFVKGSPSISLCNVSQLFDNEDN